VKISGIYAIISPSGKQYIGSSNHIDRRWRAHRSLLRRGTHHSPALQRAWDKYGEAAITFSVVSEHGASELLAAEAAAFAALLPAYNVSTVPGAPMAGRRHTAATIARLSEAATGSNNPNFGKPMTAEHRVRLDQTGKMHSAETKAAYAVQRQGADNSFYGKTHSKETLAKISEKASLRRHTPEQKAHKSLTNSGSGNPNFGRKASPETLAKMASAASGRVVSPETRAKMCAAQSRRQELKRVQCGK
jgi:group I intron endonuclease